jgi:glycerol-3-phosphate cytidylyltransferase
MSKKIVYVGGTFDLVHYGHGRFLEQAKKLGDFLVVALNTDEFSEEYKRKPILNYNERKETLKMLPFVDSVVPNVGGRDSKPTILHVKPDIIVHGDDWTGDSYMKQLGVTKKFLKDNGIEIIYVPYTKGISTSEIIKRCSQQ